MTSEQQKEPQLLHHRSHHHRLNLPHGLASSLALIFGGLIWLGIISQMEARWLEQQPWINSLLTLNHAQETLDPDIQQEAFSVYARPVERPNANLFDPDELTRLLPPEEVKKMAAIFNAQETLIATDIPLEMLEPLLVSGRMPMPGAYEVLAGDLASPDTFKLDGRTFSVVGKLNPSAGAFIYAYVLPGHPGMAQHFLKRKDVASGWIHPEGLLHSTQLKTIQADSGTPKKRFSGGQIRSKFEYAFGTALGIFLVVVGAAGAFTWLFRQLAGIAPKFLRPLFIETVQRPILYRMVHGFLYLLYFATMYLGFKEPLLQYKLIQYISSVFSEGHLQYVGEAYIAKEVLRAAAATFWNNYVMQTLCFTLGLSLIIPFAGFVKTAFSLLFAGFGLAPIWAGTADGFILHSITIVLELEAYILACFVVIVWPIRLIKGFFGNDFFNQLLCNIIIYLDCIFATAIILALAALYEAITLIHFV